MLVGIGLAAGFFSALFGVGGGILIVPLLILLAGVESKSATATSLAVIGFTTLFGVFAFSLLAEVDWGHAVLLGLPAAAGSVLGTSAQRRISSRALVVAFALFLVVVAIRLFLE